MALNAAVTLDELEWVSGADPPSEVLVEVQLDEEPIREPYPLSGNTYSAEPGDAYPLAGEFTRRYYIEDTLTLDLVLPFDYETTVTAGELTPEQTAGTITFSGTDPVDEPFEIAISYVVDEDEVPDDPVQAAVDEFRDGLNLERSRVHPWYRLNHEAIVDEIEEIATWEEEDIDIGPDEEITEIEVGQGAPTSYQLDQHALPWCGLLCLSFALAQHTPRRFVEVSRALYEQQALMVGTESSNRFEVRQRVHSALPYTHTFGGATDAEWLLLASLKSIYERPHETPDASFLEDPTFVDDVDGTHDVTVTVEIADYDPDIEDWIDPAPFSGVHVLFLSDDDETLARFDEYQEWRHDPPVVARGQTDGGGEVVQTLPDGEYLIQVRKPHDMVEFPRAFYDEQGDLWDDVPAFSVPEDTDGDTVEIVFDALESSIGGFDYREIVRGFRELVGLRNATTHYPTLLSPKAELDAAEHAVDNQGGVAAFLIVYDLLRNEDLEVPAVQDLETSGLVERRVNLAKSDMGHVITIGDHLQDSGDDPIGFRAHSWGAAFDVALEWERLHPYFAGSIRGWDQ